MKNKKIKILLIMVVLLTLGYFAFQFLLIKASEYVMRTEILNAEEIAGKTDNNSYGIRNDVYDVIQKEYFEKMNLSEEEKRVVLEYAYLDQKLISNFENEDFIIENVKNILILIRCSFLDEKLEKIIKNITSVNSIYFKTFINNKERDLAFRIYERIYSNNSVEIQTYLKEKLNCENLKKNIQSK